MWARALERDTAEFTRLVRRRLAEDGHDLVNDGEFDRIREALPPELPRELHRLCDARSEEQSAREEVSFAMGLACGLALAGQGGGQ